ncbi:hypothetical protein S7711_10355 [Stachybotrys chartarum IBT 7711]|uniref:Uncharacterized protein n=1 Tax=Stachybotrys chartarum (strain CBS 109288 / IBT 7711) TaxID=1280523 RepID=A0A084B9A8_STACB|nr:hypothetical protein S7711_10355 [Stachybotrys chartarum IBT 7711]
MHGDMDIAVRKRAVTSQHKASIVYLARMNGAAGQSDADNGYVPRGDALNGRLSDVCGISRRDIECYRAIYDKSHYKRF